MGRQRVDLLAFGLLPLLLLHLRLLSGKPVDVPVGVVLEKGSVIARTGVTGLRMALEDFYAAHPNSSTRIRLHPRDYRGGIISATSAVISLLKNEGAEAIIGPQGSGEAEFLAELANRTHVPMMSFSATSPSLSSKNTPYFIRTAVEDSAQADPIAAIVKYFKWRQVVLIYQDSEYGCAIVPFLIDALRDADCKVPYRSVIPKSPSDDFLRGELYKLKSMQTRVFVVHMFRKIGIHLLNLAHDVGMMSDGYAWIVTDEITSILGVTDSPSGFSHLEGVIGVKPYVPHVKRVHEFSKKWKRRHHSDKPEEAAPSQFVLWAYDTATALATAVERAGISRPTSHVSTSSTSPIHDLASLGVSPGGPRLLDAISAAHFDGLAGRFELVDGQLGSEGFEIVSVMGKVESTIGFWKKEKGLSRHWDGGRGDGKNGKLLKQVMWPGETKAVPRGWVREASGRRLRIAVPGPADPGFHPFLRMDWDPKTNTSIVSGFVIDVFEAAVNQLPYPLLWDYVPFQNLDRKSAGSYDDLIRNISAGKFDGVVGDVTITDRRAQDVDFTMPYTSSGVSMAVPKRDRKSTSAWIFLKPLSWKLWTVIFAFFLAIGGVIWLIEHRVNEEFRGKLSDQLGTVLYFSFSTLVFAHREKIESNLSKIVLVVWLFVVLIFQSSYTASLTSMLTVQQLQPSVTDLSELNKTNQRVGYLEDSFMKGKLLKMGFKESNLVSLRSPQEYAERLALGSSSGGRRGVAAVIDETPYLEFFLKKHCSNYTIIGQELKTGGFGFAFPRGSPLVPDLSRAILNVTEGDTIVQIERKWFGRSTRCSDADSSISSGSLGFTSFWGLFLVTGAVTVGTFVYDIAMFVYKKRKENLNKDERGAEMDDRSQRGIGSESPMSMFVGVDGEAVTPPLGTSCGTSASTTVCPTPHFPANSRPSSPPETPVAASAGVGDRGN